MQIIALTYIGVYILVCGKLSFAVPGLAHGLGWGNGWSGFTVGLQDDFLGF